MYDIIAMSSAYNNKGIFQQSNEGEKNPLSYVNTTPIILLVTKSDSLGPAAQAPVDSKVLKILILLPGGPCMPGGPGKPGKPRSPFSPG